MNIGLGVENLIFLISQPRAGSTMLQRVLAGHPEVHTTAEPWLMLHPIYALRERGHEAEYGARTAFGALKDFLGTLEGGQNQYFEALQQMAVYLYGIACDQAGKNLFLDKTPRYYFIIPELAQIFPGAKFIILLRNPLSVLASILNTWVKGEWIRLSRHYENLVLAPRLLLEGIELLGSRATVVYYENLVSEPASQVANLCVQLGLDFEPEMLEYGNRPSPKGRHGDPAGVHKHMHPTTASLDRWLELGHSRQTRHLADAYLASLGPELVRSMGYDYEDMKLQLDQVPCKGGAIVASWNRAFSRPTFWNQSFLIFIELAQRRSLAHSGKQMAKLFQGYSRLWRRNDNIS
jgi:hypothetical protein